jgi:hypothetical protein
LKKSRVLTKYLREFSNEKTLRIRSIFFEERQRKKMLKKQINVLVVLENCLPLSPRIKGMSSGGIEDIELMRINGIHW